MAVKRRAPAKPWRMRKKARWTRRSRRLPGMRSLFNKPAFIKRKFLGFDWTPSSVATTDFWKSINFRLTDMYNSSEITALFDQYRINGILVEMHPRYDNFGGNDTTDTTAPGITAQGGNQVHVIVDPYNDTVPSGVYNTATLNFFLEKGNVRTFNGANPIRFFIRPTVENNVGTSNVGRRIRAPYCNTSASTVPHFGAQVFIADPNLTGFFNQSYAVFYTFYLSCKGMR